jgi:hypothetical protein
MMNNKNISIRLMTALGIALVLFLGARSQPVRAVDQTDGRPLPMVGLAKGQTARLNVVNVGNPNISPC